MAERIDERPVGGSLFFDGSEGSLDLFLWDFESKFLFSFFHCEEDGGSGEAGRKSREVNGVVAIEVEVAPAAIYVLSFEKHLDLFISELLEA